MPFIPSDRPKSYTRSVGQLGRVLVKKGTGGLLARALANCQTYGLPRPVLIPNWPTINGNIDFAICRRDKPLILLESRYFKKWEKYASARINEVVRRLRYATERPSTLKHLVAVLAGDLPSGGKDAIARSEILLFHISSDLVATNLNKCGLIIDFDSDDESMKRRMWETYSALPLKDKDRLANGIFDGSCIPAECLSVVQDCLEHANSYEAYEPNFRPAYVPSYARNWGSIELKEDSSVE